MDSKESTQNPITPGAEFVKQEVGELKDKELSAVVGGGLITDVPPPPNIPGASQGPVPKYEVQAPGGGTPQPPSD